MARHEKHTAINLGLVSCLAILLFGGLAFSANQTMSSSEGAKDGPKRYPPLSQDELKEKAKEYGGQPPSSNSVEDNKKGPPPPKINISGCECQSTGELRCEEELTGYQPGAFWHPRLKEFAHSVAILSKLSSDRPAVFRLIKTVGQTDGLENKGVCCWRDLLNMEQDCGSIAPDADPDQRLFEEELGLARACLARKALEREFEEPLPVLPKEWPSSAKDIETGGSVGGQYRKIAIELWIKDGCPNGKIGPVARGKKFS